MRWTIRIKWTSTSCIYDSKLTCYSVVFIHSLVTKSHACIHVYLTSINRKPSWSNHSHCWVKGIDCVGPPHCRKDNIYTSGSPQICAASINRTRETCSIRTPCPLYPACDLKNVYILAMTRHYRVNNYLIF